MLYVHGIAVAGGDVPGRDLEAVHGVGARRTRPYLEWLQPKHGPVWKPFETRSSTRCRTSASSGYSRADASPTPSAAGAAADHAAGAATAAAASATAARADAAASAAEPPPPPPPAAASATAVGPEPPRAAGAGLSSSRSSRSARAVAWPDDSPLVPQTGGAPAGDDAWAWMFLGCLLARVRRLRRAALALLRRFGLRLAARRVAGRGRSSSSPLAAPLLLSTDAWTYWDYGRIAAVHDANPYRADAVGLPATTPRSRTSA